MINGEQISRILKVMRQYFDYIVVDTCSLPDQVTSAALDEANRILLVTTPEVPALKNAARFYRLADEFGYRSKIVAGAESRQEPRRRGLRISRNTSIHGSR